MHLAIEHFGVETLGQVRAHKHSTRVTGTVNAQHKDGTPSQSKQQWPLGAPASRKLAGNQFPPRTPGVHQKIR